ncbi:MAG TPA: lyase family protein, partial [Thermoanaerobaculia bacterium]
MTMWGGRFSEGPSALLRALNDSFAFDRELFAEDVEGSIAWAHELARAGVLSSEEESALIGALVSLTLGESDAEDVHSYVEASLRALVGPLAGKLHTGRSRNDQVATDLKLWLKKACADFDALVRALAQALAAKASEHASTP